MHMALLLTITDSIIISRVPLLAPEHSIIDYWRRMPDSRQMPDGGAATSRVGVTVRAQPAITGALRGGPSPKFRPRALTAGSTTIPAGLILQKQRIRVGTGHSAEGCLRI